MKPLETLYEITRQYLNDQICEQAIVNRLNGYIRARRHDLLADCSKLYSSHRHGIDEWRVLRQVEAFFKKNSIFSDDVMCSAAALSAYKEAEELCERTNRRLQNLEDKLDQFPDHLLSIRIRAIQKYIKYTLGSFELFESRLPELIRVTSGATANSKRQDSLPQLRMKPWLYCSSRASRYVTALYNHFGFGSKVKRSRICDSNRVELVPKDWKRHRTIACEPEGNIPLQLAFDVWAKGRLALRNINLCDQSRNQRLARSSSIDGYFVTVDFKAASDTVSQAVVKLLFPKEWYEYLSNVRSPYYRGVFGEGVYEKFSSMGNGSTFCIESLIFAGVCYALGSRKFSVYGDDVILDVCYYKEFLMLTQFLGFTINTDKSFHKGPVRESCGKEYFNGVDVTPVYIRNISSHKAKLCHLVNTLGSLTKVSSNLWNLLRVIVTDNHLPSVPYNEGTMTGVWIDPVTARRKKLLQRRSVVENGPVIDYFRAYSPLTRERKFIDSRGYYLWFLNKRNQVQCPAPWSPPFNTCASEVTSSVSIFQHEYRRKWTTWHPPSGLIPAYVLYAEYYYERILLS